MSAVELHCRLLPSSPPAALGSSFLRDVYYGVLIEEGLAFGFVALYGGRPVGFMLATPDSNAFMRKAVRSRFWRVGRAVVRSMLARPSRLRTLTVAIAIMKARSREPGELSRRPEGELLSFGVLPEVRTPRFVQQTGIRVSQDLFACALSQMHDAGVALVRSLVDSDNTEAKLFYRAMNWELGRTNVPGWHIPQTEFVRSLDSSTSVAPDGLADLAT